MKAIAKHQKHVSGLPVGLIHMGTHTNGGLLESVSPIVIFYIHSTVTQRFNCKVLSKERVIRVNTFIIKHKSIIKHLTVHVYDFHGYGCVK